MFKSLDIYSTDVTPPVESSYAGVFKSTKIPHVKTYISNNNTNTSRLPLGFPFIPNEEDLLATTGNQNKQQFRNNNANNNLCQQAPEAALDALVHFCTEIVNKDIVNQISNLNNNLLWGSKKTKHDTPVSDNAVTSLLSSNNLHKLFQHEELDILYDRLPEEIDFSGKLLREILTPAAISSAPTTAKNEHQSESSNGSWSNPLKKPVAIPTNVWGQNNGAVASAQINSTSIVPAAAATPASPKKKSLRYSPAVYFFVEHGCAIIVTPFSDFLTNSESNNINNNLRRSSRLSDNAFSRCDFVNMSLVYPDGWVKAPFCFHSTMNLPEPTETNDKRRFDRIATSFQSVSFPEVPIESWLRILEGIQQAAAGDVSASQHKKSKDAKSPGFILTKINEVLNRNFETSNDVNKNTNNNNPQQQQQQQSNENNGEKNHGTTDVSGYNTAVFIALSVLSHFLSDGTGELTFKIALLHQFLYIEKELLGSIKKSNNNKDNFGAPWGSSPENKTNNNNDNSNSNVKSYPLAFGNTSMSQQHQDPVVVKTSPFAAFGMNGAAADSTSNASAYLHSAKDISDNIMSVHEKSQRFLRHLILLYRFIERETKCGSSSSPSASFFRTFDPALLLAASEEMEKTGNNQIMNMFPARALMKKFLVSLWNSAEKIHDLSAVSNTITERPQEMLKLMDEKANETPLRVFHLQDSNNNNNSVSGGNGFSSPNSKGAFPGSSNNMNADQYPSTHEYVRDFSVLFKECKAKTGDGLARAYIKRQVERTFFDFCRILKNVHEKGAFTTVSSERNARLRELQNNNNNNNNSNNNNQKKNANLYSPTNDLTPEAQLINNIDLTDMMNVVSWYETNIIPAKLKPKDQSQNDNGGWNNAPFSSGNSFSDWQLYGEFHSLRILFRWCAVHIAFCQLCWNQVSFGFDLHLQQTNRAREFFGDSNVLQLDHNNSRSFEKFFVSLSPEAHVAVKNLTDADRLASKCNSSHAINGGTAANNGNDNDGNNNNNNFPQANRPKVFPLYDSEGSSSWNSQSQTMQLLYHFLAECAKNNSIILEKLQSIEEHFDQRLDDQTELIKEFLEDVQTKKQSISEIVEDFQDKSQKYDACFAAATAQYDKECAQYELQKAQNLVAQQSSNAFRTFCSNPYPDSPSSRREVREAMSARDAVARSMRTARDSLESFIKDWHAPKEVKPFPDDPTAHYAYAFCLFAPIKVQQIAKIILFGQDLTIAETPTEYHSYSAAPQTVSWLRNHASPYHSAFSHDLNVTIPKNKNFHGSEIVSRGSTDARDFIVSMTVKWSPKRVPESSGYEPRLRPPLFYASSVTDSLQNVPELQKHLIADPRITAVISNSNGNGPQDLTRPNLGACLAESANAANALGKPWKDTIAALVNIRSVASLELHNLTHFLIHHATRCELSSAPIRSTLLQIAAQHELDSNFNQFKSDGQAIMSRLNFFLENFNTSPWKFSDLSVLAIISTSMIRRKEQFCRKNNNNNQQQKNQENVSGFFEGLCDAISEKLENRLDQDEKNRQEQQNGNNNNNDNIKSSEAESMQDYRATRCAVAIAGALCFIGRHSTAAFSLDTCNNNNNSNQKNLQQEKLLKRLLRFLVIESTTRPALSFVAGNRNLQQFAREVDPLLYRIRLDFVHLFVSYNSKIDPTFFSKVVVAVKPDLPSSVNWIQPNASTNPAYFTAEYVQSSAAIATSTTNTQAKTTISFNLKTFELLVNGNTLGILPKDIKEDTTFVRMFGANADFDVFVSPTKEKKGEPVYCTQEKFDFLNIALDHRKKQESSSPTSSSPSARIEFWIDSSSKQLQIRQISINNNETVIFTHVQFKDRWNGTPIFVQNENSLWGVSSNINSSNNNSPARGQGCFSGPAFGLSPAKSTEIIDGGPQFDCFVVRPFAFEQWNITRFLLLLEKNNPHLRAPEHMAHVGFSYRCYQIPTPIQKRVSIQVLKEKCLSQEQPQIKDQNNNDTSSSSSSLISDVSFIPLVLSVGSATNVIKECSFFHPFEDHQFMFVKGSFDSSSSSAKNIQARKVPCVSVVLTRFNDLTFTKRDDETAWTCEEAKNFRLVTRLLSHNSLSNYFIHNNNNNNRNNTTATTTTKELWFPLEHPQALVLAPISAVKAFEEDQQHYSLLPDFKILLPDGLIDVRTGIITPFGNDISCARKFFSYEVHPHFPLPRCQHDLGRLHLAALLLSSCSASKSSRLHMTSWSASPAHITITLLRQCFHNTPLTNAELQKVETIIKIAKCYSFDSVILVASALLRVREQCSQLPFQMVDQAGKQQVDKVRKMVDSDMAEYSQRYLLQNKLGCFSSREMLNENECAVLGLAPIRNFTQPVERPIPLIQKLNNNNYNYNNHENESEPTTKKDFANLGLEILTKFRSLASANAEQAKLLVKRRPSFLNNNNNNNNNNQNNAVTEGDSHIFNENESLLAVPFIAHLRKKKLAADFSSLSRLGVEMYDDVLDVWQSYLKTPYHNCDINSIFDEVKEFLEIPNDDSYSGKEKQLNDIRIEAISAIQEFFALEQQQNQIPTWVNLEAAIDILLSRSRPCPHDLLVSCAPTFLTSSSGSSPSVSTSLYDQIFTSSFKLSPVQRRTLQTLSVIYLESCVLLDKFARLRIAVTSTSYRRDVDEDSAQIFFERELLSPRAKIHSTCISFIAFEAENRLQIRPNQFDVFEQLTNVKKSSSSSSASPSVIELSVGEGKTRTIVPMLCLYYLARMHQSTSSTSLLPILHILGALRTESVKFFRSTLTASAMNISVLEMPFSRDVKVEEQSVANFTRIFSNFFNRGKSMLLIPRESSWSWLLKEQDVKMNNNNNNNNNNNRIQSNNVNGNNQGNISSPRFGWMSSQPTDDDVDDKHEEAKNENNNDSSSLRWSLDSTIPQNVINIFDEADELFNFKLHMAYSCGNRKELDALEIRALVMSQSLLALAEIQSSKDCDLLFSFLEKHDLLTDKPSASYVANCRNRGEFPSQAVHFRSVSECRQDTSEKFFATRQLLRRLLIEKIADNVNNDSHLEWLRAERDSNRKNPTNRWSTFISFVTDPACDKMPLDEGFSGQEQYLLALRGVLLVVLEHCLQLRLNVRYGLRNPSSSSSQKNNNNNNNNHKNVFGQPNNNKQQKQDSSGSTKRIAVPYEAADTPSKRSEFQDPDIAMMLTYLTYLDSGISLEHLREALEKMNGFASQQASAEYNRWFESFKNPALRKKLPSNFPREYSSIDAKNDGQLRLIHGVFGKNMRAVFFWLRHCVFPDDMKQYEANITATSWDLAHLPGEMSVGFSGTMQTRWLWPTNVKYIPAEGDLASAAGRLLLRLVRSTKSVTEIATAPSIAAANTEQPDQHQGLWRILIEDAITNKSFVIIDVGALLVGTSFSRREIVRWLLTNPESSSLRAELVAAKLSGVTYFDQNLNEWSVWTFKDVAPVPLDKSSVPASETFVIYDEARCRGADLKLKKNVVATLTLALRLSQDKFVQAAGRLRQLGPGSQQLRVVATTPVIDSIIHYYKNNSTNLGTAVATTLTTETMKQMKPRDQISLVLDWALQNSIETNEQGMIQTVSQGMSFYSSCVTSNEQQSKNSSNNAPTTNKTLVNNALDKYDSQFALVEVRKAVDREMKKYEDSKNIGANAFSGWGLVPEEEKSRVQKLCQRAFELCGTVKTRMLASLDLECEREVEAEEERECQREQQNTTLAPCKDVDSLSRGFTLISDSPPTVDSFLETCSAFPLQFSVSNFLAPPAKFVAVSAGAGCSSWQAVPSRTTVARRLDTGSSWGNNNNNNVPQSVMNFPLSLLATPAFIRTTTLHNVATSSSHSNAVTAFQSPLTVTATATTVHSYSVYRNLVDFQEGLRNVVHVYQLTNGLVLLSPMEAHLLYKKNDPRVATLDTVIDNLHSVLFFSNNTEAEFAQVKKVFQNDERKLTEHKTTRLFRKTPILPRIEGFTEENIASISFACGLFAAMLLDGRANFGPSAQAMARYKANQNQVTSQQKSLLLTEQNFLDLRYALIRLLFEDDMFEKCSVFVKMRDTYRRDFTDSELEKISVKVKLFKASSKTQQSNFNPNNNNNNNNNNGAFSKKEESAANVAIVEKEFGADAVALVKDETTLISQITKELFRYNELSSQFNARSAFFADEKFSGLNGGSSIQLAMDALASVLDIDVDGDDDEKIQDH